MGEDSQGFVRLWERICKDSRDLGEDHKDLRDFGRGFARIHKTLGEDSQGFARLWERIRETLGEDSRDFGRGFMRIRKDS